jgi:hypothetical protein
MSLSFCGHCLVFVALAIVLYDIVRSCLRRRRRRRRRRRHCHTHCIGCALIFLFCRRNDDINEQMGIYIVACIWKLFPCCMGDTHTHTRERERDMEIVCVVH